MITKVIMCGIVGALDLSGNNRTFPHRFILSMTQAIAHRGPDDESVYIKPGIAIGVRRLSIVDINNGRQPISNQSQNLWVAFNGELFDYRKLRHQLLNRNIDFSTNCDTEIWLHLYEQYQEQMFQHTQGQFAVSLWDAQNQILILGRDRVGICPLYYTIVDGWLLWASEIKSILATGLIIPKPDLKGIDHLFNFFCAGSVRTFFEEIKLIPPGHYLRVKGNQIKIHQYWDLNFPDEGDERKVKNPIELSNELNQLLYAAVAKRMQSDVPVVNYLSGGVDSSLILALSCKVNNNPVPSYTISLNKVGRDEKTNAEECASLFNSNLTTLYLDGKKIVNAFPELILATEGPLLDTSCSALMQLANIVNDHGFKVALSGEGADEALAGYFCFKMQKITNILKGLLGCSIPTMTKNILQKSLFCDQSNNFTQPNINQAAQQFLYETVGMTRSKIYSKQMLDYLQFHNPYEDLQIINERMQYWHPLNQSLYVSYKVMLPGLLMLSKGDRIAMHSSVEMRYPYLDENIIAFCATIDPAYKLRGLTEKWLLRKAAANTLPAHIANRRKINFSTKLSGIFLNKDRPIWVDQLLSEESLKKSGYFNLDTVAKELKILTKYPRLIPRQFVFDAALTTVITTQLWHHLFFDELCELPTWTAKNIKP
jgi:asparagine synthase (glutamine-hydrolysing)